jgi:glutamate formiminotransferase/glutamate formiminotransferase/formiminotetrahydrofolate cyclodeaminase
MTSPILLAVPNVSEGRSAATIAAIGDAFLDEISTRPQELGEQSDVDRVRLLDVHSDPDHHRSVFTLAARPLALAEAMLRGAAAAVERINVMDCPDEQAARGQHPHVGALDVAPVVYLDPAARGAACAEALVLADRIGSELDVPVFLYGELTSEGSDPGRTRAELRRGGVAALALRMGRSTSGSPDQAPLRPDFGPPRLHPSAGATLVAAREPLVAFNLQLAPPATVQDARMIAAAIREGGERGMPGLRAIGVALSDGLAQVSMNVERPLEVPLAAVVERVRAFVPVASAELVGLAPLAALAGFPEDLPMPGFDPARHVIENALGC